MSTPRSRRSPSYPSVPIGFPAGFQTRLERTHAARQSSPISSRSPLRHVPYVSSMSPIPRDTPVPPPPLPSSARTPCHVHEDRLRIHSPTLPKATSLSKVARVGVLPAATRTLAAAMQAARKDPHQPIHFNPLAQKVSSPPLSVEPREK